MEASESSSRNEQMNANPDYRYRMAMSAIGAIAAGAKDAQARASIQGDVGRTMSIEEGLNQGIALPDEVFHEDHWDIVQAAFAALGASPSKRVSASCNDLRSRLELLGQESAA